MKKSSETRSSLRTLKVSNQKLVLKYLRNAGTVSVNEIAAAAHLSKMTVHKILDYYVREEVVSLAGKGASTEEGGKRPNLYAFNVNHCYIFAVRIGADFLSTSIVNLKGAPIAPSRTVSLEDAAFDSVMRRISETFDERVEENDLPRENCIAAVVACEGVVDTDRGVCITSYQYSRWGANMPVRDRLETLLPGNIPVHVDSLWRHLAHTEVFLARAEGREGERRNFFLLGNSGDFISGGMVVDGQAFRGVSGFAGEVGHMIVDPRSTVRCVCGGYGCLESLVVPRMILKKARELFPEYPDSLIFNGSAEGEVEAFCDIGWAADKGDALARRLLDEAAGHFAVAINNIIVVCDPGRIVLFGEYARCGEYFLKELRRRAAGLSMNGVEKCTVIEATMLEEQYGVIGAANHIADKLFEAM